MEKNIIHHGDCLEGIKLLPDQSIDCIVTDPPYNINLVPQRRNTLSIENDNMDTVSFEKWLTEIAQNLERVLKKDSFLITFCGWPTIPSFRKVFDSYFTLKSMPIWVKNIWGIGYYTRPQYEPMLLYMKGKPGILENPISDVMRFDRIQAPIHSCEKPIKLIRHIVKAFSKEKDIICDPFIGSGTTALACKQLGRDYIGFEINKSYISIAQKRLQQENLTGWLEQ
jgi:DNA modification methylase